MDPTLWLTHRALPHEEQATWVKTYLAEGKVPPGLLSKTRGLRDAMRRQVEEWAARAEPHRIRWLTPLDSEYPRTSLERLHDPPGILFVRGDPQRLRDGKRVAIVGARRGTSRARRVAHRMGATLARAKVTVVSGLALGIDAAAHRGCVEADGHAIAVLAGGLDQITPVSNTALGEAVLERGLLVSEYPPGTVPQKRYFVARNRIIAGLSDRLVVVEAAARSGALGTMEFASEMGMTPMVVPGPVDCPHAQGTLQALHDGATPVRHGTDVLDALGLVLPAEATAPLGLGGVPETTAEVARRVGLSIPAVLAALGEAELLGAVQRVGADRWAAPASDLPADRGRA